MLGNSNEPGVTSSVDSAPSVSGSGDSPGTPAIVGQADLSNGTATAGEVYAVSDSAEAQTLFGKKSRLTQAVLDAINMGAAPILAVAPAETTVTQDISGLGSTTGQLDTAAKEDVSSITVTVDGSSKTVKFYLEDVSSNTVNSGNVHVNPATDDFELDAAPSSSGSIDYTELDYAGALNAVASYNGDVDFVTTLKERSSVTTNLLGTVTSMANDYQLALAVAGVEPPVDPANFTNSYDDSRLQLVAPSRQADLGTALGAFVGMRANIGITATPINQRLALRDRLHKGLDGQDRGDLIDSYVTPLERIGSSARVADDLTTVSDSNSQEQNYKYGFSRLVVDFVILTVNDLERPFVGKFNSPGAVGQLEDLLTKEARPLTDSNAIYSYEAEVTLVDPTTASVTFRADVAEPIRFIENDFVIGNNLSLQNQ